MESMSAQIQELLGRLVAAEAEVGRLRAISQENVAALVSALERQAAEPKASRTLVDGRGLGKAMRRLGYAATRRRGYARVVGQRRADVCTSCVLQT